MLIYFQKRHLWASAFPMQRLGKVSASDSATGHFSPGSFEYTPLLLIKVLSVFSSSSPPRLRIGPRDFMHTHKGGEAIKKKLAPGTKTLHTHSYITFPYYTHAQSITLWLNPRIMQKKWTCSSLVLLHLPRAAFFLASCLPLENFTAFIYHARSQPTVTHHYYFFPTCKLPGRDSFAVVSFNAQRMHFWQKKISTNFFLIQRLFMKAVEICKSALINCHKRSRWLAFCL